jgi:drug/metabolite transporter (DMT)-like permease
MWQALSTTILFSLSAVCAQRSTRLLGGVTANLFRICVATLVLGAWAHLVGQGFRGVSFPLFFLSGVVGFGFGDVALYQAFPRIGSRLSILLVHCVAAPFAALVEWCWLGTPLTAGEGLAALTILGGVAVALAPGEQLTVSRKTLWVGVGCAVIGALGQGGGAVLSRKAYALAAGAGQHIDGMTAAYQRIVGGVLVAVVFFLLARWRRADEPQRIPWGQRLRRAAPWTLANALAGPAVGVAMFQWALMLKGTGVVLPIVALTPLVIIPFSRFVEGERAGRRSILGGLIAVAGVVALTLLNRR